MAKTNARTGFWRGVAIVSLCVQLNSVKSLWGAVADHEAVARLVRATPVISLDDPAIKSFSLVARIAPATNVGFICDVAFMRDKHYAMSVRDRSDNTPFLYAIDKRLIAYDPVDNDVLTSDSVATNFELGIKKDSIEFNFGWDTHRESGHNTCQVNVRSFVDGANELKLTKAGAGLRLTGVTRHGKVTFFYDDTASGPIFRSMSYASDDGEMQLGIDQLRFGGEIAETRWAFPAPRDLDRFKPVRLEDLSQTGCLTKAFHVFAGIGFRAAFNDTKIRTNWDKQDGPINWTRAKELDRDTSAALRNLLTGPRPTTQAGAGRHP